MSQSADLPNLDEDISMSCTERLTLPDTPYVVLDGSDLNAPKICNIETKRIIRSVIFPEGESVYGIRLSEDRTRLAVESTHGEIAIVELPTSNWKAEWELCTISETEQTLKEEEEYHARLSEAEQALNDSDIGTALDILQKMRSKHGFKKTKTWEQLFAKTVQYCKKTGLHSFYRAATFKTEEALHYIRFGRGGTVLIGVASYSASTKDPCEIFILDAHTLSCLQRLEAACPAFAVSHDGNQLAYYARDYALMLVNLIDGSVRKKQALSPGAREVTRLSLPSALAFHPNRKELFMMGSLWDCDSLEPICSLDIPEAQSTEDMQLIVSASGNYLAYFVDRGGLNVNVYDSRSQKLLHRYTAQYGNLPFFSPCEDLLAIADSDVIRIYDPSRTGNFSDNAATTIFTELDAGGCPVYTSEGKYLVCLHSTVSSSVMQVYDVPAKVLLKSGAIASSYTSGAMELSPDDSYAIANDTENEELSRWEFDWNYSYEK